MKWINVAQQPPNKEDVVIRDISSKVCLHWMYIRKITPEFITATIDEEFGDDDFPSNEYEWLDESTSLISEETWGKLKELITKEIQSLRHKLIPSYGITNQIIKIIKNEIRII